MTPEQKSALRSIAAELVRGRGMPPEDQDYLPKSASRKLRKELHSQAQVARSQCRELANRIMRLVRQ